MVGRTNVGGGGSDFVAYIQVTTDPNAVITATNPAGNTFTGTADSTGALTLTVRNSGTYTVSETGAPSESVVVSDYGEIYTVSIAQFDGYIVNNGTAPLSMVCEAVPMTGKNGFSPTVSDGGTVSGYHVLDVREQSGGSGRYRTADLINISNLTKLNLRGGRDSTDSAQTGDAAYIVALDENGNSTTLGTITAKGISEYTYNLTSLDRTKRYRFGIHLYTMYTFEFLVNEMRLTAS